MDTKLKTVIDSFNDKIDYTKEYTLDELKKLLSETYKSSNAKKVSTEKRPPTEYNIFMKEKMAEIKSNPENKEVDNRKIMQMAASLWKQHKEDKNSSS